VRSEPTPRTTWLRLPPKRAKALDDARVLAERVVAMRATGLPLIKGEPPRWRDMAVLARRNDMLEAAAHALAERGVPYVVAGRGFYTTREVRDLAAMLALLLDPSDRHAMVQVLRGPWAGVHDETLLGLTDEGRGLARLGEAWDHGPRRSFVHPENRLALADLRRVVETLSPELDRVGPGVALRAAVRDLRLEETWIQLPRGAQRVANGRKLLAMADLAPSTRVLIDRLQDAAEREDPETEAATFSEDEDAVRLLTIHASKGLDFPIVFLPQLAASPRLAGGNAFTVSLGAGRARSQIAAQHVDEAGRVHEPPSVEALRVEANRRETAELQRLTYVAVTRASDAMILIGAEGKEGAPTTAGALTVIAASDELRTRAQLVVEDVALPDVASLALAGDVLEPPPIVDEVRVVPRWRSLPIAPTALQDFARCPRRFQLVHLLHLPEPNLPPFARTAPAPTDGSAPRLDPRAEGTLAHRLLERVDAMHVGTDARAEVSRLLAREGVRVDHPRHGVVVERVARFLGGAYARRASELGAGLVREEPFVLHVDAGCDPRDAEGPSRDGRDARAVVLRGTIDLVVLWPDGSVDVLDYKSARGPDAEPYAFQLDVYAHAARARWPNAPRLRTGIVFLGGSAAEPSWREPRAARDLERDLAALGSDLVLARWRDEFPAAALSVCHELHCGYRVACHPDE
jgi:ATP-dependent helicase/nuclease subunit A